MDPAFGQPAADLVQILLGAIALAAAAFVVWGLALNRNAPPHRLGEGFGAEHVKVVEWAGQEGYVRAGGELWRAVSADALAAGDDVSVDAAKGLVLRVSRKTAVPIGADEEGE